MKIAAIASSGALAPITLSESVSANKTDFRESLVDDLVVTNADDVERTFYISVTETSGNAESVVFEEEITVASGDSTSYKTAFPRGTESRLSVETDGKRSATRNATVVGQSPLTYGFEVAAKPGLLAIYSRHVDPGPDQWGDN